MGFGGPCHVKSHRRAAPHPSEETGTNAVGVSAAPHERTIGGREARVWAEDFGG